MTTAIKCHSLLLKQLPMVLILQHTLFRYCVLFLPKFRECFSIITHWGIFLKFIANEWLTTVWSLVLSFKNFLDFIVCSILLCMSSEAVCFTQTWHCSIVACNLFSYAGDNINSSGNNCFFLAQLQLFRWQKTRFHSVDCVNMWLVRYIWFRGAVGLPRFFDLWWSGFCTRSSSGRYGPMGWCWCTRTTPKLG